MANSLGMITKQQIRINYIKEISIKLTQKRKNIVRYLINYSNLSANSLAMITKQQFKINYIEQISIKCDGKKIKCYAILKKLLLRLGPFFGHYHKTKN